jgi:hypothetical protein
VPRTVRDWVTTTGDHRLEETGDDGWSHLSAHDRRRTWGTLLVGDEVEPKLVMEWGDRGDGSRGVSRHLLDESEDSGAGKSRSALTDFRCRSA